MKKVLAVTVRNYFTPDEKRDLLHKSVEFEALNKHLEDGWEILNVDYVNSKTTATFSAIYLLEK